MVAEADEYDRSFLHLHPAHAAILSMDPDHLDIYGDKEAVLSSGFLAFARQVKPGGTLLVQQQWIKALPQGIAAVSFGLDAGNYRAENIGVERGKMVFDLVAPDWKLGGWQLPLPGRHNVENTIAAIALADQAGADPEAMRSALPAFRGIRRRFDIRYRRGKVVYVDDYAHHPTELEAAIRAAKEFYPGRRLSGMFQPHLYSRTRDFASGFARALDQLDETMLLEIYPAREEPIEGVSSELIARQMKKPTGGILPLGEALRKIEGKELEVLMTLGAGNIDTLVRPIEEMLEKRFGPTEKNE
jgi:UDP-N-acetylmuramate--alanine ligase